MSTKKSSRSPALIAAQKRYQETLAGRTVKVILSEAEAAALDALRQGDETRAAALRRLALGEG